MQTQKIHFKQLILFYVIGITVAFFSKGVYQLDEHFQVLEWSRWIMGLPFSEPWEATQSLRHPLLAYIMVGLIRLIQSIGISDPESIAAALRIFSFLINGTIQFFCIYLIASKLFKGKRIAYSPIILFTAFPLLYYFFSRTSTENFGTSCLLLSITLLSDLDFKKNHFVYMLSGFFTVMAFAMRFPLAAAMSGHAFLLYKKIKKDDWNAVLSFLTGIFLGVCLFMFVEYSFYNHPFLSPIQYFKFNAMGGASSTFGTDPGWEFVKFFLLFALPFNLFFLKTILTTPSKRDFFVTDEHFSVWFPLFLSSFTFIAAHMFIGHKEMRFMLPLIPFLFIFYVYFSSKAGLLKNHKILLMTFVTQLVIVVVFQITNRFSFNYMEMGCGPYQFERKEPITSVWSERSDNKSMGFHKLPAFYCGTPNETLPIKVTIPVESFKTEKELRTFLKSILPSTPPPQELGKPRYIDKDGFFRSYEDRLKQVETLPLLVSFRRYKLPAHVPDGCECGIIEPYEWHGWIPEKIRDFFEMKFFYYLYCPKKQ